MEIDDNNSSAHETRLTNLVNYRCQPIVFSQNADHPLTASDSLTPTDRRGCFAAINWVNKVTGEFPNDFRLSQEKFADLKIVERHSPIFYQESCSSSSPSKDGDNFSKLNPCPDSDNSHFLRIPDAESKSETTKKASCAFPFKCMICDKTFNSKINIRLHMLKRHRVKSHFTCELCGEKLQLPTELLKHCNSEHKSLDDIFYCKKCDFNTTNYIEVLAHAHEVHTCSICGKTFKSTDKFESHKLSHSTKQERKNEKNFTCDTCGKRFAFGCLLRDHINLHTGAKPYLCPVCGRSFSQKASLKQHARTHNAVRPHKCTECDQGFYSKGDLKKHFRKHTGERPYVCEICGEGFSQSSHLGFHRKTHTGERPYTCDLCGRGFTKKGDVTRHRRIHTGELPYLCQVCGKVFRQSTQCSNHIKNHHPNSSASVALNPSPISSTTTTTTYINGAS